MVVGIVIRYHVSSESLDGQLICWCEKNCVWQNSKLGVFGLRNDRKSTVKQHYHHFYTKFDVNTLVYKGEASLHFWCFFLEWCATRMCHRICWKLLCTVQIGQLTPLRHGNHKQLKLLCWRECCVHITAEPEAMNTGDHSRVHWFRGKSQMYIFTLQTKARC